MLITPIQPSTQPQAGCSPTSGHSDQCRLGSLLTRGSRISDLSVS